MRTLTLGDIASHLRVSRWAAARLLAEDNFREARQGRPSGIPVAEYLNFLTAHTVPAARSPQGAVK